MEVDSLQIFLDYYISYKWLRKYITLPVFSWVQLGAQVHKIIKPMKIEPLNEFLQNRQVMFLCVIQILNPYLCKGHPPYCIAQSI